MFEKFGGRKLAVSLLVMATGLGITLGLGDIPDNLLQLLEVIVASFVGGNIAAQVFGSIKPIGKVQKPDSDDEGSTPVQPQDSLNVPPPAAPPMPQPIMSEGIPVQVAVDAFRELGVLIGGHADRQAKQMEELMRATQINQQALSVVVEKVMLK